MCVYMYICVYYMYGIYARVCASTCICAQEGQTRMLGILLYHVLSFSFQTGNLTEHRARLIANKTQGSCLLFPQQHWDYRQLPSFTWELGCELRSSCCSASTLTHWASSSKALPPGIFFFFLFFLFLIFFNFFLFY